MHVGTTLRGPGGPEAYPSSAIARPIRIVVPLHSPMGYLLAPRRPSCAWRAQLGSAAPRNSPTTQHTACYPPRDPLLSGRTNRASMGESLGHPTTSPSVPAFAPRRSGRAYGDYRAAYVRRRGRTARDFASQGPSCFPHRPYCADTARGGERRRNAAPDEDPSRSPNYAKLPANAPGLDAAAVGRSQPGPSYHGNALPADCRA